MKSNPFSSLRHSLAQHSPELAARRGAWRPLTENEAECLKIQTAYTQRARNELTLRPYGELLQEVRQSVYQPPVAADTHCDTCGKVSGIMTQYERGALCEQCQRERIPLTSSQLAQKLMISPVQLRELARKHNVQPARTPGGHPLWNLGHVQKFTEKMQDGCESTAHQISDATKKVYKDANGDQVTLNRVYSRKEHEKLKRQGKLKAGMRVVKDPARATGALHGEVIDNKLAAHRPRRRGSLLAQLVQALMGVHVHTWRESDRYQSKSPSLGRTVTIIHESCHCLEHRALVRGRRLGLPHLIGIDQNPKQL